MPKRIAKQKVSQRRAEMILYNLPNITLSILGIAWVIYDFGWRALFSLPFIVLVAWLIFTSVFIFLIRWQTANKKTDTDLILDKLDEILKVLKEKG
jgi:uncharacterized membrane protein